MSTPAPADSPTPQTLPQVWIGTVIALAAVVGAFFGIFDNYLSAIAPADDVNFGHAFPVAFAKYATLTVVALLYAAALGAAGLQGAPLAQSTRRWLVAAAALLALSLLLHFAYLGARMAWTFHPREREQETLTAGLWLTEAAAKNPNVRSMDNAERLSYYGGKYGLDGDNTHKVWPPTAILAARLLLLTLYVLTVLSLVTTLFVLAEVIRRRVTPLPPAAKPAVSTE